MECRGATSLYRYNGNNKKHFVQNECYEQSNLLSCLICLFLDFHTDLLFITSHCKPNNHVGSVSLSETNKQTIILTNKQTNNTNKKADARIHAYMNIHNL